MARNTWTALYNDDPRGLSASGLTIASFTTATDNTTNVFPTVNFPKNYFKTGKLLHLRARGTYGTTGSPTYTISLKNLTGTSVVIVTSAAVTAGTTQTNMPWEVDIQIQCRTEGTSGTLWAQGDANWGLTSTTQTTFYLPAAGTAPATATVDTTLAQDWQLQFACSASSASNTVTGTILELKTLN